MSPASGTPPPTPHDIYERHKRETTQPSSRPARDSWDRTLRAHRLRNLLLALIVIVVLGGVAYVTILLQFGETDVDFSALDMSPPGTGEIAPPPPPLPRAVLDLSADPRAQFMLDALDLDGTARPELPEAGAPLTTFWLKEATYYLLTAEQAREDNRLDDALAAYERVWQILPTLTGLHATIGMLHMQQRDYAAAADAFERSLAQGEAPFGVINNLGVAYLQLEDYADAERYLMQAVRLREDYAPARFNLASLYVRREQPAKAAEQFSRYLELEPENLNATLAYAAVLLKQQAWDEAVATLETALTLAPESPPIHFRLSETLARAGRSREAMRRLDLAIQMVDGRTALGWMSRSGFDNIRATSEFQALIETLSSGR
jgi:tetratricopeptide (TPR) repeat protein